MEKITEEMNEHQKWYKDACDQTLESLPKFLRHLSSDYEHDYGTVCHAISASAVAAAHVMDKSTYGGISGFQAGCVMWGFIRYWNNTDEGAMRLVTYNDMLYPQYQDKFEKTISQEIANSLIKKAKELLEERKLDKGVSPIVRNHWQEIANGNMPFGYTIKE